MKTLTLYNKCSLTDETLALLAGLDQVEKAGIDGAKFTDDGMVAVARLPHLTDLRILHTPVTDAGVACLTNTALRSLRLAPQFAPRITDAALPHIAAIKSLESLNLGEMKLTWDDGLKHLKSLPKLK